MRKGVAAGAMAVAMFATSMPAMASNGLGLGFRAGGRGEGLHLGFEARGQEDPGLASDLNGLKSLEKDVRNDLRDALKTFHVETDATATAEVAAQKQCRKTAKTAYADAAAKARQERDSALKSAVETYTAALLSARAAFHASISAGGVSISADASAAAYAAFRQSFTDAQKTYRAAKASVAAAYRAELDAARTVYTTADQACKA